MTECRINGPKKIFALNPKNFCSGGSFGQVEIPLSSLVGADKDKEMLPLLPNSPSQTLTLAVKIRFPAPI